MTKQCLSLMVFVRFFQSPCESNPCRNGADCVPEYKSNLYRCHCKLGSFGTHCQVKVMGGIKTFQLLNIP